VIHEMTSRLAGVVLRLWTHQGGHLLLFYLYIRLLSLGCIVAAMCWARFIFLYVISHSVLYFDDGLLP